MSFIDCYQIYTCSIVTNVDYYQQQPSYYDKIISAVYQEAKDACQNENIIEH